MHPHKLSASHTLTFLSAHCRLPCSVSGSALLATAESSGSALLGTAESSGSALLGTAESSGSALLATAESSGSVVLYSVEREMEGAVSVRVAQRCAVVENGLCLSLDWNHCPQEQG